jgi:hypothetical protein
MISTDDTRPALLLDVEAALTGEPSVTPAAKREQKLSPAPTLQDFAIR